MHSTKVLRLLSITACAAALGGCATFAKVAGVDYNPDAPECQKRSDAMDARITQARGKAPDPKMRLSGSWKCVAEGYSSEYWRISQSEGRLTAVIGGDNGNSYTAEGALEGSTALWKSSLGAYYELTLDGGAATGDILMPPGNVAFTECTSVRTTCTRST